MALAYLTINLDAFTGDDHPPVSQYSTITLDPGVDHIDAANDVIHVRTIVVSLDQQGKAATANGVPCPLVGPDQRPGVPLVPGVTYAVSASLLRAPLTVGPLTPGQIVDLADVYVPGEPITPDQASVLSAQIAALQAQFLTQDEGVAALVGTSAGPKTQSALARFTSLLPGPLVSGTVTSTGTVVHAVTVIDGVVYGASNNTSIYASEDDGATWSVVDSVPGGSLQMIVKAADGEMVAWTASACYKSAGWGTGTTTWSLKITANGAATSNAPSPSGRAAGWVRVVVAAVIT